MKPAPCSGETIGIGHTTPTGAVLHLASCECAICREHRELTAIIERVDERGWIVSPAARQRLHQIKAEQQAEVNHD